MPNGYFARPFDAACDVFLSWINDSSATWNSFIRMHVSVCTRVCAYQFWVRKFPPFAASMYWKDFIPERIIEIKSFQSKEKIFDSIENSTWTFFPVPRPSAQWTLTHAHSHTHPHHVIFVFIYSFYSLILSNHRSRRLFLTKSNRITKVENKPLTHARALTTHLFNVEGITDAKSREEEISRNVFRNEMFAH